MGQAPLLRRGHCRPQAHDSGGGPRDKSFLDSSDPKEGRLEHR